MNNLVGKKKDAKKCKKNFTFIGGKAMITGKAQEKYNQKKKLKNPLTGELSCARLVHTHGNNK